MSASNTAHVELDEDFLEAEARLEDLHTALQHADSPTVEMKRLEEIWHRVDEVTRYKILTELIDMEYSGAIGLLEHALQHDANALVRHEAAFGLGVLGNSSHFPMLVAALLNDDNPMVRHEAAIALGEIGDSTVLEALETASEDEQAEVAVSARYAIKSIRLRSLPEKANNA